MIRCNECCSMCVAQWQTPQKSVTRETQQALFPFKWAISQWKKLPRRKLIWRQIFFNPTSLIIDYLGEPRVLLPLQLQLLKNQPPAPGLQCEQLIVTDCYGVGKKSSLTSLVLLQSVTLRSLGAAIGTVWIWCELHNLTCAVCDTGSISHLKSKISSRASHSTLKQFAPHSCRQDIRVYVFTE